jgi:hypothetical protein
MVTGGSSAASEENLEKYLSGKQVLRQGFGKSAVVMSGEFLAHPCHIPAVIDNKRTVVK